MKSRFSNLFRLFSPNPSISSPPSRQETPSPVNSYRERSRYHLPDSGVMRSQVNFRSLPPLPADAHGPDHLSRFEPAYPPLPMYSGLPTYNAPSNLTSQQSQDLSPTEHICAVCASIDRFPVRPSRCPFTGQAISPLPIQQNHPSPAGTLATDQVRQNMYGQLVFVEGQPDLRTDSWIESKRDTEEWAEDSPGVDAEYGDYYMIRKSKKRIDDWLEWCVVANCPGYEKAGKVMRRAQRMQGYGIADVELSGKWDWRFDDELWNNRIG